MESYEYRETDVKNQLIDKEDGLLPGLLLGLGANCQQWEFAIRGSQQSARLDYDGQTNQGAKFLTRTQENIREVSAQVGRRFWVDDANSFGVYGGAGYWRWQRDIAGKVGVSGLEETYRWRFYYLGSNVALIEKNLHQLLLDFRWVNRLQSKISVDIRGSHGDATLNVRNGWRVALPWQYKLNSFNSMHVEPYVESWQIERTETEKLFRGGEKVGVFYEPASKTRLYGITLNWLHHF
jgi:hypothetical protein